jgi:signal transduction histidine kinase
MRTAAAGVTSVTNAAGRLGARLITIQAVASSLTGLIVALFAPRLLLLDETVVQGSFKLALWGWGAAVVLVVLATWLLVRSVRPLLARLAVGVVNVASRDVHSLYAAPARLVALDLAATLLVATSTLVSPLRPETNDLYTQFELVLLAMTMASVAVLPAYVMMRASVARVLELVPIRASREALEMLVSPERRIAPIRHRLLVAVVAPVAFVALGSSLLVHAHLDAFDTSSLSNGAAELAQGVFDALDGDVRGRDAAVQAARADGFDFTFSAAPAPFSVSGRDEGKTVLTVPLSDGHAILQLPSTRLRPWFGAYLLVALAAILVAGIVGHRLGGAFANDVALATYELEATGVADVLRGQHILGGARFESVAALMAAADDLGGIFREFASAQQRAIDASAATERTRGLFLASMSHDLKAPLNAILGFAELVSRGVLTAEQRESVAIIARRGRELLYLIDTILDAARVEAGELTVSPEYARVGDVITTALMEARALVEGATGATPEIIGEIQDGISLIFADPARLAQALTAIILVACRFAERGHVVVRVARPSAGAQQRIDVEVAGRGVVQADREKVFEAFQNADRARRHGSLGLGPSLARAIVELHGGSVAVETSEATGTAFHVLLPGQRAAL